MGEHPDCIEERAFAREVNPCWLEGYASEARFSACGKTAPSAAKATFILNAVMYGLKAVPFKGVLPGTG
jgi:hypothetical protein